MSALAELQAVVGRSGVLDSLPARRSYAQDGYTLESGIPDFIVLPETTQETQAVVGILRKHGIPIVARGAGTSLSGGAIAAPGSAIIHLSRMRKIHQIDWVNRVIEVDPGVINAEISRVLAPSGFFYAPDPSSQQSCTVGGNFAENSGGPHCLKYGVTVNHILMADVVMPDGALRRFGNLCGEPDGPDWLGAIVGSEGTLGIATRLWLVMTPTPRHSQTILGLFDSVDEASQTVTDIIASGIIPAALEMMDQLAIRAVELGAYPVGYPDDLAAVLLVELDGDPITVEEEARRVLDIFGQRRVRAVRQAQSLAERNLWWANRKTAFGAMGLIAPRYYVQDGVIPRHALPETLTAITRISADFQVDIANVFHAGDGNLHPLLLYDHRNPAQVERVRLAGSEILQHCVEIGGSITGEHGIGLEKLPEMVQQFSPASLAAQRALKTVFDPTGLLNPGKVLPLPGRCIDFSSMG